MKLIERAITTALRALRKDWQHNIEFCFTPYPRWFWRSVEHDDITDTVVYGGGPFFQYCYWK